MSKRSKRGRRSRRQHLKHQRFKKTHLLLLILGILALVLSGVIGIAAWWQNSGRLLQMAGGYLAGSLALLGLWRLMSFFRDRRRRAGHYYLPGPVSSSESSTPRDGLALVAVLITLAILSVLLAQAQFRMRQALRLEQARLTQKRLRAAAIDEVRQAMRLLADDETLRADDHGETWAKPLETARPDGLITLRRIEAADARFDLNNLAAPLETTVRGPEDILVDLFIQCGYFASVDRVDSLKDWEDPDDDGIRETDYYSEQPAPYTCRNGWIHSWSELMLVKGFERKLFIPRERYDRSRPFTADLADCVTLIPRRRSRPIPVNINLATRETLLGVLGMEQEALVNYILVKRKTNPFRSIKELQGMVEPPAFLEAIRPYLAVRSSFFIIRIVASRPATSGGRNYRLRALVQRTPSGAVQPLRWNL